LYTVLLTARVLRGSVGMGSALHMRQLAAALIMAVCYASARFTAVCFRAV